MHYDDCITLRSIFIYFDLKFIFNSYENVILVLDMLLYELKSNHKYNCYAMVFFGYSLIDLICGWDIVDVVYF